MSRSLLKLVLILMVVGILPFGASLLIVNRLLSTAVSVGLNSEVEAHLQTSAETHRSLFGAEKTAHELAADLIAAGYLQEVETAPRDGETTRGDMWLWKRAAALMPSV